MFIYVLSNDDYIIKAFNDENKAERYTKKLIKITYNIENDNIYIDKYDDFILYTFKNNNNWTTFKINKIELV